MRKLIVILGIPIDDLTMPEALDRLDEFIRTGRETGKSHQVATVNADFVVKALDDPELRGILQESDMATADGMPLVWGARLLGVDLQGRVTGADMVPALAARAAEKGYRVYLLGAAPGVAARAAEILKARHPALQIVGIVSPPYGSIFEMDPAIAAGVEAAHPDILLVAFGNPKQEKWISMYSRSLHVPVMIGIGGTLDFIAGVTRRAPEWMQRSGLEWVFRLVQEPKRLWRRYVVDMGGFGLFFVRQWWAMRRAGQKSGGPAAVLPLTEPVTVDGAAILPLRGRLDRGNQAAFVRQADEALAATRYLVIDMTHTEFVDSSGFGALVSLTKRAREAGGEMWLTAMPEPIARVMTLLRLDRFFEVRPDTVTLLAERAAGGRTAGGRAVGGRTTAEGASAEGASAEGVAGQGVASERRNTGASPAPAGPGETVVPAASTPTAPTPPSVVADAPVAAGAAGTARSDVSVIAMPRRLDASTADAMEEACRAAIVPGVRLVLDFSQTTFLASAGMAAMIRLKRDVRAAAGELQLAGCSADILRTLQLTRLDAVLSIAPDVDAAVRDGVR